VGPSLHQTREKMAVRVIRNCAHHAHSQDVKGHMNVAYHSVSRNPRSSSFGLLFSRNCHRKRSLVVWCIGWHLSLKPVPPSHLSALYCASLLTIFSLSRISRQSRRDVHTAPHRVMSSWRKYPNRATNSQSFNLKLRADVPLHPFLSSTNSPLFHVSRYPRGGRPSVSLRHWHIQWNYLDEIFLSFSLTVDRTCTI